ncbi:hypothetical protein [Actinoplanes sp. NPDC049118]|uniref:hypothetical protein n=1 Tax=Actinoplanes sp. NPDC049118 TaxID=3155769 RepID=UPI0033C25014
MSRRRLGFAVAGIVLLVLCLATYGTFIPRIPLPFVSVPSADVAATDHVLVPASPPAGLAPFKIGTYGVPGDRLAVYAEPGPADVFAGRALGVIYMHADEFTELPYGTNMRPVRVNLHQAHVGRVGDQVWVVWDVWFDDNQEQDQIGVIGFGLTEDEVVRAARHVYVSDDDSGTASARLDWGGVPSGLAPAAAGPADLDGLGHRSVLANSTVMIWGHPPDGPYLTIAVCRGDAGAAVLARLTTLGTQRPIRGAPASVGTAPGWPTHQTADPATAYAWAENGLVVYVTARGIPAGEVDAVIAGLRLVPVNEATALFPR